MKKLLSIILAAMLLLSVLAVPVYADGPITFEFVLPYSYEHGTDEIIVAEIRVNNNVDGISATTFYIDLPECLTTQTDDPMSSMFATTLSAGFIPVGGWASDGPHRLSVGLLGFTVYKGDGAIVTINLVPTADATKEDLENMSVNFGIREAKTADGVTHKGEDEYVQVSDSPIKTPTITCIHPDIVEVEGKDPTCTEPGYSAGQKCAFCGEPIGDTEIIPALGHDYKYDHTIEEPTCTSVGKDLYKCSRCGQEEEREVPMKDHVKSSDYKYDDESHWFYCVNCDTVIGEKEAHDPDTEWHCEDTSVNGHYHICSVCKAAVEVEEHVDEDADGECDICGSALHVHVADLSEWKYDDEGHYHACTVPGCKAKLDKTAHDKEEKVTKEATCTEKGVKTISCKVCDYEKTEDIDMIPHTPDTDWHTEEGSEEHWHVCAVCGTKLEETAAAHTYGEYTSTEKDHTHVCTACGASETEAHKGGTATCSKKAVCKVCSTEYGEFDKTNHADGIDETAWESDGTNHWHVCKYCGEITGVEAHKGGTATCSKKAVCEVCNTEYGELDKTNHADGIDETAWEKDGTNHWHVCKYCGEKAGVEAHKASEDYKHDASGHWHYCTVCGEPTEEAKAHTPSSTWTVDPTGHWHICTECTEKVDFDAHTRAQFTSERAATTTADGNLAYWYCPDCGKYFYDNDGKIGAGPYDSKDEFATRYNVGCDGNHQLVCVPVSNMYHIFVCRRQCGFVLTMPHNFGLNGICHDCGYVLRVSENSNDNVVEVETPTEGKINHEEIEIVG